VLFVLVVLGLKGIADRALSLELSWARPVVSYGIGSLAALWFVQSVAVML
jgi:hypothetical protein